MKQARWFILLALILIAGIAAFFIIRGIQNRKTDDPTVTETAGNDTTAERTEAEETTTVHQDPAEESPEESGQESEDVSETEDPEEDETIVDDYTVTYGENESIIFN